MLGVAKKCCSSHWVHLMMTYLGGRKRRQLFPLYPQCRVTSSTRCWSATAIVVSIGNELKRTQRLYICSGGLTMRCVVKSNVLGANTTDKDVSISNIPWLFRPHCYCVISIRLESSVINDVWLSTRWVHCDFRCVMLKTMVTFLSVFTFSHRIKRIERHIGSSIEMSKFSSIMDFFSSL